MYRKLKQNKAGRNTKKERGNRKCVTRLRWSICNVADHRTLLQVSSAGSRLLVQEPVFDKFIGKLKQRMQSLYVGDSLSKKDMGAIVDSSHQQRIETYVSEAQREGAEVREPFVFI